MSVVFRSNFAPVCSRVECLDTLLRGRAAVDDHGCEKFFSVAHAFSKSE